MKNDIDNQIDRFLLGEMDAQEEKDFIEKMNQDENLKNEVELTASIIGATREIGKQKDIAAIDVLKNSSPDKVTALFEKKKQKKSTKWLYWTVSSAAVVLFAILIGSNYYQNNFNQQTYLAYYQPLEDDTGIHRGSDSTSDNDLVAIDNGLKQYHEKNYSDALQTFSQVSNHYQYSVTVYRAVCMLEIGQTKEAISILENAIKSYGEGWEYYQDARWYLALAYLKNNDRKKTINLLNEIIDENKVYAEKAYELLRVLKR